ncbi:MAG TPA: cell division protein FtsA [Candidatus Magasanikbacteria bacterium]|uniref:Cell division protein FtsA n=2 Tax=Candidatus Magasanikiibacteriota TaxID=1752731 RepID=A0A0G1CXW6_9BACT|nr:MAG: Cell division protein ftsA [Candidatus Magasanikbacteria bacterium GW2011_GWC2_41_17]KKS54488.1 MAG: Cell division protein ftsA [Candidatus Magasanikbacteria bacterium GW2011_GWA2_42_32]HBV58311.1 cell division protein FtsA [Candidatus Magasanikbacteria bacterium]HBX16391.1 cell division protein FtsA [Candidatus Magasanikbacteria bacterium]
MFGRKASHQEIIVGLDVGSTAVRLAVGQLVPSGEKTELHIIAAAEAPSEGVHKGVVTSIEDVVSSISSCLERAERMTGLPIKSAWVGISGSHIISEESKGVIAVSKPDGEISEEDVDRAIEAARTVATPLNYEILHVIPKNYTVDGQVGIKDPIGMTGVRLEVDTQIIQGLSAQIKNLTKTVYRTGLDIDDLVLSILATAEAVVTERQKELGVAVLNMGGATTSLVIFEEGDILDIAVLSIGSEHITTDIAIGLRTSIDVAEKLKLDYGSALPKDIGKKEELDLFDLGEAEHEVISRKYACEILEARAEEILMKVDDIFKKLGRSGMLPAGVVLTGGGSKLPGLVELAKRKLRLPAALGYPLNLTSVTDKINDLSFASAIGLVRWGAMSAQSGSGKLENLISRFGSMGKVKKWMKSMMP